MWTLEVTMAANTVATATSEEISILVTVQVNSVQIQDAKRVNRFRASVVDGSIRQQRNCVDGSHALQRRWFVGSSKDSDDTWTEISIHIIKQRASTLTI